MRLLYPIVTLIAAVAIGLPAWLVVTHPSDPKLRLQAMAESSCKCARTKIGKTGKAECWRKFEADVGQKVDEAGGTACFPLSTRDLYLNGGFSESVTVGYDIVGGTGGEFCTEEEAKHAEAVYAEAEGDDPSNETMYRADAAMKRYAQSLAKGEQVAALPPSYGCVSGNGG